MKAPRLFSQAARSMTRYKLRTGFMMLGSFVGVAALTFVVSVGRGAEGKLLRTMRQIIGDASMLVVAGGSRMMGNPRGGASRLTLDDMFAVAGELPEIESWDPQADYSGATVRAGDAVATARVIGQSERWEHVWGRGVSRGESFDAAAVASSARVAVIGETLVRKLFGSDDPIGADVRIGSVAFKVIGVLEPFGSDMHGMDRDNEVVIPVSTMMRRITNVDVISGAKVLVKDPTRQRDVARDARRIIRARHALDADQPDDVKIVTSEEVQKTVSVVQSVLRLYVPLAGAIILVVGGIVAATLMLASVSERVAEIGLRRAIGARPADIRWQFLLETAGTVVVGGLGGIIVGYIGSQMVAHRTQLDVPFSWQAVVVSLAASVSVGLLAGVAPARRAALLNPADALR
ncbi:MAG: ABC transporter permease [bacterium]